MRVLADYHHHDLWESLELLFNRLGWDLYRPIGMEWFEQGYWNHERKWHGDAIARQYLERWGSDTDTRLDRSHGRYQRLVGLAEAREQHWDVVLSTLAHNHEGMARFASEVGATFGIQLGNVRFSEIDMAEDRWDLAAFGLVSGYMPRPIRKPHVVYHQEFSLSDFAPAPPPRDPDRFRVASFVQCYKESPTWGAWEQAATAAPELDWRVYGAYGSAPTDQWAAGNIDVCADVARAMQASDVAWHAKAWSDGFGHVIHNWHAIGRPMFGFRRYYEAQMAGALWLEGETCFDIEDRSRDEVLALLRRFRDDEDFHLRACERSAARFREVVDFEAEAEAIRALFAQVLP
jgi:hypothetical protein